MIDQLQAELGHRFEDPELLERALTHSSFGHENVTADNERLEFLGDAVLQMCTTLLLMEQFPTAREGELSRLRSRLVNTDILARIGREISLGDALRLGRGEHETGGRSRKRNLANATEALLGAVYRDAGFQACRALVARWMVPHIAHLGRGASGSGWKDPRSLLQEHTQRDAGQAPTYVVVERVGPPHAPTFEAEVRLDTRVLGSGTGRTKRSAFRAAAEAALEAYEGTN